MLAPLFTRSWLALVMVSGCFSEAGALDEGGDTTSSQTCSAGAIGCACYGNSTCDVGLACVAALDVCVPMDCTPGSLQCVCDDGGCEGALVCTDGVCAQAMPGTASSDPSGDPSGDPSSSTHVADESTDSGTSSDPTGSDPADSSSSGSAEGSTLDDTGVVDCGALACAECVVCVAGPDAACTEAAVQCGEEVGCEAAAACLASCGVNGLCLDDCCAQATPMAASAAMALNACRHDECAAACGGDYNIGQCTG